MLTARRLRIAISSLLVCVVLACSGCGSREPKPQAPTQSVVGLWTNAAAKGQPASLSEIGFGEDGTFRHSGNNALGMPVNFAGRYQVVTSTQGSVIRLIYDDFPDKPTALYFLLEGDTLTVAPRVEDLATEAATIYQRAGQQ